MVWANDPAIELWAAESFEALTARDMSDSSDVSKARLAEFADGFAVGKSFETNWTLYPRQQPVKIRFRCRGVPAEHGRILMLVHVIGLEGRDSQVVERSDQSEELIKMREQLAHAEARYRAFAEAGTDWFWETDKNHRFIYYSPRLVNYFGYTLDGVFGKTRSEHAQHIGADPDTDETREKWAAHEADQANRRPFRDFEYAIQKGVGKTGYLSTSGSPVYSPSGEFQGYRGSGRDITRRVEAEGYARQMERERDGAVTANSVTNQFLATMSHELRTPLNAILGFSEVMMDQLFGPMQNQKYHGYATDIFDSARHLLSIVEDLLNVSRLDVSDDNLDLEPIPARQFVAEMVRMTRSIATGRDLHLSSDIPDPKFEFLGDRRALRQVMFNLISNSIKYTKGGGEIEIRCALGEDGSAEIAVRDNGSGIKNVDLPHIFEPFHSVDPRIAKDQPGAGLGLWICKRIVEAHKGQIDIESVFGTGTTATVRLPGEKATDAEPQVMVA